MQGNDESIETMINDRRYTSSQVVDQLFKGMLLRPASKQDCISFAVRMASTNTEIGIEELSRQLADCPEFRSTRGPGTVVAFCNQAPYENRFPHVISFGGHCYTAKLLQKGQLKKYSTPFDWIFSNADMIAHCLNDDFSTFLNADFYESSGDNRAEHLFYKTEFSVNDVFNHRDPLTSCNYAYYIRTVERIRSLKSADAPVLCLLITPHWNIDQARFLTLSDAVSKHLPSASLLGISVHAPTDDSLKFGYEINIKIGKHVLYDYYSLGHLGPLDFSVAMDNVIILQFLRRIGA